MPSEAVSHGVIVADDSSIVRLNLRAALGDHWHVFLARNGEEACAFARGMAAALVVLDYRMSGIDGLAACRLIRALPRYAGVPIVILTAYDNLDLRRQAAEAGAAAVFPKPFTTTALRDGLMPLIALYQDAMAAYDITASVAPRFAARQALADGHAVLAVHRRVDAAAREHQPIRSFADIMASQRARARR